MRSENQSSQSGILNFKLLGVLLNTYKILHISLKTCGKGDPSLKMINKMTTENEGFILFF